MKKTILLLISLAIFTLSIAQNKKALDEKNGFRDLKFGMTFDSIQNLNLVEGNANDLSKWYEKTDDKLSIGYFEIESISYGFYRGKLDVIIIRTKGYSNSRGILSIFENQYGKGYKSNPYMNDYYWFGKNVTLSYDENSITNDATIIISTNLFKEMKQIDKKAALDKAKNEF